MLVPYPVKHLHDSGRTFCPHLWIGSHGNLRMRVVSPLLLILSLALKTPIDVMLCEADMLYPLGQIHPQQVDNPALKHLSVDRISDIHAILNGIQMDFGDCHF